MHFLAIRVSSQDLNRTRADDKHGCAGFSLLEEVLPIPVVSFVDEPSQPPEMPKPEVFEELDPLEEARKILVALLARGSRKKTEQRARGTSGPHQVQALDWQ